MSNELSGLTSIIDFIIRNELISDKYNLEKLKERTDDYLVSLEQEESNKISELETENLILEMKLSNSEARCSKLLNRYRSLAKYNRKLIKQSIEDLHYYDFENKH